MAEKASWSKNSKPVGPEVETAPATATGASSSTKSATSAANGGNHGNCSTPSANVNASVASINSNNSTASLGEAMDKFKDAPAEARTSLHALKVIHLMCHD